MTVQEIKTSSQSISPDKALQLLEEYKYEYQRPVNQHTVEFLRARMLDGSFTVNIIALGKIVGSNGKGYVLNGQHTLWALSESGKTLTLPVVTFWVTKSEDLDDIYATFDQQQQRSFRDVARAKRWEEKTELDLALASKIGSAVLFIQSGFARAAERIDKSALVIAAMEWVPYFQKFRPLLAMTKEKDIRQALMRRGILSAILLTFYHKPSVAQDFWEQVIADNGLMQYDPRHMLNKQLIRMGSEDGRMEIKPEYEVRLVAACWNAFCTGRELRILKANMETPLNFKGCSIREHIVESKTEDA